MNFTTDILISKNNFEIEVPLCGFGMFFRIADKKCENYREYPQKITSPQTKNISPTI